MLKIMDTFLPLPELGHTPLRVLSIAGSDSGGGAGIQAELRTFALSGVHALTAITAVTAQNSVGVQGVHALTAEFVIQQITSVHEDIGFQAVKTGMLANAEIIDAIARHLPTIDVGWGLAIPLVVDPVSASMHGSALLEPSAYDSLRYHLISLATIVTPNLDEVKLLADIDIRSDSDAQSAADYFLSLGAYSVLLKGGHAESKHSVDYFYSRDDSLLLSTPRLANHHNDHGSGDTLASAISAALAHGLPLPQAVSYAKQWVTRCIAYSYPLGAGHGPVNAMWRLY